MRIAVEPGHGALEANAAGQKDRDWHIVLADMLQEGVLESVRMRCSHDRSPWTSSHLLANGPALCPEANARAPFCAYALHGERNPGWDQVTGSLRVSGASTSH